MFKVYKWCVRHNEVVLRGPNGFDRSTPGLCPASLPHLSRVCKVCRETPGAVGLCKHVCSPAGAKERWRRQVEPVTGHAEVPRRDGVVKLGQLPPPPLVNGLPPGAGHTEPAKLSQPHSEIVDGRTEEQEQQVSARAEQGQRLAHDSRPAQVAASSTQLAPAQQAPAERSASQPSSQARQRPEAVAEAIVSARHHEAAPARRALPTAEQALPMHSPLGPPVPGKSRTRSQSSPLCKISWAACYTALHTDSVLYAMTISKMHFFKCPVCVVQELRLQFCHCCCCSASWLTAIFLALSNQ